MDKVEYYLVQEEVETTREELDKLISVLNTVAGVGLQKYEDDQNKVTIFYSNNPLRADLTLLDAPTPENLSRFTIPQKRLLLVCEKADNLTVNLLKDVSKKLNFRVFCPELSSYLPSYYLLYDCVTGALGQTEDGILAKFGLKPVFWLYKTYVYFAQSTVDGSIHFVNGHLMKYFVEQNQFEQTGEFSYKVADNLEKFVSLGDVGLIPLDFYQYYKKPLKIINHSGFDLESPGRKVFIKPYIFQLNNLKQGFYTIASETSPLLAMDKIRPGETLDASLKRIISVDLKIASDYLGAIVHKDVEFDRDRDGVLTPRLVVNVYLEKANLTPKQEQQKNQGWISSNSS